jgi:hypothetical protein
LKTKNYERKPFNPLYRRKQKSATESNKNEDEGQKRKFKGPPKDKFAKKSKFNK